MNTQLVPGTRVVVSRRGYRHHGIYAGHGRVIHYAGWGQYPRGRIEEVSLQQFTRTRPLQVGVAPDASRASVILQRARSRLGECQYDLLRNNCEHFCNWCELGEPRSLQVETLARPVLLLLRTAVRIGQRWNFLTHLALLESNVSMPPSLEAQAANGASRDASPWIDL